LTESFAVFEAAIPTKSMHLIKSCSKTRIIEKYGN